MDSGMTAYLMRLLRETGADIAGCGFQSVSVKEPPEEIPEPDAGEKIPHRLLQGSEIAREIIVHHDTRVWSKLFTRKTALSARFQEGLTIGEDMLYVLSCAGPETKYAAAAAPLYHYTVNPEGAMNRPFTRSYMDQLLARLRAGGFRGTGRLENQPAAGKRAARFCRLSANMQRIYKERACKARCPGEAPRRIRNQNISAPSYARPVRRYDARGAGW